MIRKTHCRPLALLCLLPLVQLLNAQQAAAPTAIVTFNSIGLYWSPLDHAADNNCAVRYRPAGDPAWRSAMDLWYDPRTNSYNSPQYRGSLVNLTPDTNYEIELTLTKTLTRATLNAKTWSENFPIAQTVTLPESSTSSLNISQGGTSSGYILYTHAPGKQAVIDGKRAATQCITVSASYVIIRGITCINPARHGILINDHVHDVVIEDTDISGWGSIESDGWGHEQDSAVYAGWSSRDIQRIIIQRNRFHHPSSDSNNWGEYRSTYSSYHPDGPQGIALHDTAGNHVIRYNEIYSDADHYFNDVIGGATNYSSAGFPGPDSDINGNRFSNCWDDGIEAEGGGRNVRIWGNYIDHCFSMIAAKTASVGPLYVWRNITGVSQKFPTGEEGGCLLKAGDATQNNVFYGGGRVYLLHNAILQPDGATYGVCNGPNTNIHSRNNILNVRPLSTGVKYSIDAEDPSNSADYDYYNGRLRTPPGSEVHGFTGSGLKYDPGNQQDLGQFYLDPASAGCDTGLPLPNFNYFFTGSGPDIGAHERGTPRMEFGIGAYSKGTVLVPPTGLRALF